MANFRRVPHRKHLAEILHFIETFESCEPKKCSDDVMYRGFVYDAFCLRYRKPDGGRITEEYIAEVVGTDDRTVRRWLTGKLSSNESVISASILAVLTNRTNAIRKNLRPLRQE